MKEIRKSNELEIGKAGEYLVCCDLAKNGVIAFLSDQGLPYDVLIDVDGVLLKCQVKTSASPTAIARKESFNNSYVFRIKKNTKGKRVKYEKNEVDVFALVSLDEMSVGYFLPSEIKESVNIRCESEKGNYGDEKNRAIYERIKNSKIQDRKKIAESVGVNLCVVNKALSPSYPEIKKRGIYMKDKAFDLEFFRGIK